MARLRGRRARAGARSRRPVPLESATRGWRASRRRSSRPTAPVGWRAPPARGARAGRRRPWPTRGRGGALRSAFHGARVARGDGVELVQQDHGLRRATPYGRERERCGVAQHRHHVEIDPLQIAAVATLVRHQNSVHAFGTPGGAISAMPAATNGSSSARSSGKRSSSRRRTGRPSPASSGASSPLRFTVSRATRSKASPRTATASSAPSSRAEQGDQPRARTRLGLEQQRAPSTALRRSCHGSRG